MANELRVRANFTGGLIDDNPLTSGATTLTSNALQALQVIGATQHMVVVLDPDGYGGNPEIAYLTGHTASAGTATLLRGQEGSTARAHLQDTPWVHSATVADFAYFEPFDPDALTTGESTMRRREAAGSVNTTSGIMRLGYFTARKTEVVTQVRLVSGGTAAGATPTLCRAGVYTVAANGDITLVGSIANDTALLATTFTQYTRSLSVAFTKTAGIRYAVGVLVVTGATAPTLMGTVLPVAAEVGAAPRLSAFVSGQSDLPGSVVVASVTDSAHDPYVVLLP